MDEFLKTVIPDSQDKVPDQMEINSSSQSVKQTVASLVFVDLETTGLPGFIGKKNVQITELSMVAIDRLDFEDYKHSPRVINKLSVCIQPRAVISPGAMQVTGLSNDILESQQPFNQSVPKLLDLFLGRLRQPVCLLAHNGKNYDFPILQAELKRLNCSLSEDVLCADTLEAFRKIGLVPPNDALSDVETSCENKEDGDQSHELELTDDDIERLLSEDIHLLESISVPHEPHLKYNYNEDASNRSKCNVKNKFAEVGAGEHTPVKTGISPPPNGIYYANGNVNETPPENGHSVSSNQHKSTSHAKRRLFTHSENETNKRVTTELASTSTLNSPVATSTPTKKATKRPQYSLEKLYIHYFGEMPPDNHHAESDCINLSKVCQKVSKSFLPWLDENSLPFSSSLAMW